MLVVGRAWASTHALVIRLMYRDLVVFYAMRRLLVQAMACDSGNVCDTWVAYRMMAELLWSVLSINMGIRELEFATSGIGLVPTCSLVYRTLHRRDRAVLKCGVSCPRVCIVDMIPVMLGCRGQLV